MEIVILDTSEAVGELVADTITKATNEKPEICLGVATGSSPLPTYQSLARRVVRGDVSLANATAFLLDEYIGLGSRDQQSYAFFIDRHLTSQTDLAATSVHSPDTQASDLLAECARYESRIEQAGGIDIQLLGIGTDGHVGFNEPSSSLASRTRPKTLTAQTRHDNARFFSTLADVPHHVITQGLGTILQARHLILVATGLHKAPAVAAAVEGPVTSMCPGSILQLHPHATVIADSQAASELRQREYYQYCWVNKPVWQGL